MKTYVLLVSTVFLQGCGSNPVNQGSTGANLINIGDNAWRLTTIDNTEFEAARVGTAQAIEFCRRQGKVPFFSTVRTANDMPARHISTMEFQGTASGSSPEAQAEAAMRGYQRDCAIAGFPLGSPENQKCAAEVSAKANPKAKPVPAR
jgi:hypothetical protein